MLYERALQSGYLTNFGQNYRLAQKLLNEMHGGHWVIVTNGTVAIEVALQTRLKTRSSVLVPDFTFAATINAVARSGHNPLIVPCEAETFQMKPSVVDTLLYLETHPKTSALLVVARDTDELCAVVERLEGSLTGCLYTDTRGSDDTLHDRIEPALRARVGRLLNDKMPTGVAVTAAMNHGGPYPSTGHPGFTAVGIPASLRRFAMLQCYDQVRPERLPLALRDAPPHDRVWRLVDGEWRRGPVGGA